MHYYLVNESKKVVRILTELEFGILTVNYKSKQDFSSSSIKSMVYETDHGSILEININLDWFMSNYYGK